MKEYNTGLKEKISLSCFSPSKVRSLVCLSLTKSIERFGEHRLPSPTQELLNLETDHIQERVLKPALYEASNMTFKFSQIFLKREPQLFFFFHKVITDSVLQDYSFHSTYTRQRKQSKKEVSKKESEEVRRLNVVEIACSRGEKVSSENKYSSYLLIV